MTRLTFSAVQDQATDKGLELIKLTRGYKIGDNGAYTFKNLQEVVDHLDTITKVETANESIQDYENCDDYMQVACTLTSEIDSNPFWFQRSCDVSFPEYVETQEKTEDSLIERYIVNLKSDDKFWQNWQTSYDKAIASLQKPIAFDSGVESDDDDDEPVDVVLPLDVPLPGDAWGENHALIGVTVCLIIQYIFTGVYKLIKIVYHSPKVRQSVKYFRELLNRPISNPFKSPYGVSW
jgi:hypothetical protein